MIFFRRFFLTLAGLLILAGISLSASLTGSIVDENNRPITGASIVLEEINRGTLSDGDGCFLIKNLKPGDYTVVFSHVACQSLTKSLKIVDSQQEYKFKDIILAAKAVNSEDVIFTLNRTQTELRHNPRTINLVTAEKIKNYMPRSSAEALREINGIHIQKTSHGGGSATLRGLNSNRVLLLVDGIRLNNSTYRLGNHPYLATVDYSMLNRIEVVQGPTSVQYGSDAMGGTINLISNLNLLSTLDGLNVTLNNRYASTDRQYVSSNNVSLYRNNWGLSGGFTYKSFGDLIPGKNNVPDEIDLDLIDNEQSPTAFQTRDYNLNYIYKNKWDHTIQLAWQHSNRPMVPRYDKYAYSNYEHWYYKPQKRDLAYLKYSGKDGKLFKFYDIIFSWQRFEEGRSIRKNSESTHTVENDKVYTPGLIFQSQFWLKNHHFTWGSDFYYDFVSSSRYTISPDQVKTVDSRGRYPDDSNYLSSGFFVFDEIFISPVWRVTPGLRYSHFRTNFDLDDGQYFTGEIKQNWSALTSSISSIYHLTSSFALKGNVGQAFRAPNLSDMAKLGESKGELYEIPNKNLEAEKLIGFDFGPAFDNGRMSAAIVYYYSQIDDIILSAPTTLNGSSTISIDGTDYELRSKQNLGETYINGFNCALGIKDIFHNVNFRTHLSWTYGTNTTTEKAADAIPPLEGLISLDYRYNKLFNEFYCRYAAKKDRLSPDDFDDDRVPEGGNPGWFTLNYRLAYKISDSFMLRSGIENLLDQGYREYGSGINAAGRNWIIELQLQY